MNSLLALYKESIVKDGLVAWLDANDRTSYPGTGDTWYDLSGNNNHATLYNSPIFTGNAIKFDGVNDWAEIDSVNLKNVHNTGEVTYEIRYNDVGGGYLLGRGQSSTGYGYTGCQAEPGITSGNTSLSGCSGSGRANTLAGYISGRVKGFHNLSVSFSETQNFTKIYLDGIQVSSKTISQIKASSTRSYLIFDPQLTPLLISSFYRYFQVTRLYYSNVINTIRIYNRALTENEVKQNINAHSYIFNLT